MMVVAREPVLAGSVVAPRSGGGTSGGAQRHMHIPAASGAGEGQGESDQGYEGANW